MVEKHCLQCGKPYLAVGCQKRCSEVCVTTHLKEYYKARGQVRGTVRGAYHREDNLDSNYWKDLKDSKKCWLLGLITTDGNIQAGMVRFHIQKKDVDVLTTIKNLVGGGGLIQNTPTGVNYKVCSTEWTKDLLALGITPNKSLTVPWINTPYPNDYVRGLMDGDGCISVVDGATPVPEFMGASKLLMLGFYEWLKGEGYDPVQKERVTYTGTTLYRVRLRIKDVYGFLSEVYYQPPTIQRKWDRAQKAISLSAGSSNLSYEIR